MDSFLGRSSFVNARCTDVILCGVNGKKGLRQLKMKVNIKSYTL